MLALNLGVFHRKAKEIGVREALLWSAIWVAVAIFFNIFLFISMGKETATEFAAGYIVERTLSLDNLFVFLLIFSYFRVPASYQYKALFWRILAALMLRDLFIIAGIELISKIHWIIYIFGAFLIITGLKMAFRTDKDEIDLSKNLVLKFCN